MHKKTVITYGTFDLFHAGHLRLLERAKSLARGGRLIVGVTSEAYDKERGKLNVVDTLVKRIDSVRNTGLVDDVLVEEFEGQKIADIQRHNADIFVIGSDWTGKFDYLKKFCDVIYLERTKDVSSTEIRNNAAVILRGGIIGSGRIAKRFLYESKLVSGITFDYVYNPNAEHAAAFAQTCELKRGTNELDELFANSDVIYIASPHNTHYAYAKAAILAGKHVLCEKPLALSECEAIELAALAEKQGVVFMEALKTAFSPGFRHLINLTRSGIVGRIFDIDATFTKLITDKTSREYQAAQAGGSITELGSYAFCPIIKLLGVPNPGDIKCVSFFDNESNVDIFSTGSISYANAIAKFRVAIGGKSEGSLIISGERGYIYVPSPWWKTEYFELRDDNGTPIKRFFYQFHGDGLRYELAEFVTTINTKSPLLSWTLDDSIAAARCIETCLAAK